MRNLSSLSFTVLTLAMLLVPVSVVCEVILSPIALHLERISPLNQSLHHPFVRARDRLRHSWILHRSNGQGEGVVNFPLESSVGSSIFGSYFARVKLGSTQKEFKVLIDTGSDIPWITCSSCIACPRTNGNGVELNFFNPSASLTAHVFNCSDQLCRAKDSPAQCSPYSNRCEYSIQYEDGIGALGYYVSDNLIFDVITGRSPITNSSATIVFGCGHFQDEILMDRNIAIDGVFGFGQGALSISSQFFAQGLAPKVFSHCLSSGSTGGGIMVLGEIMESSIVYTPLVRSRDYYGLHLENIAVNGAVAIAPGFNREIIIDPGTVFAYIPEDFYSSIFVSITAIVAPSFTPVMNGDLQCYFVPASATDFGVFLTISFNFTGGASIVLKPEQYLLHQVDLSMRCTIFTRSLDGKFIFGDLVLRDTIVVYNLACKRVGSAPYDCSKSVNVSINGGSQLSPISFLPLKFTATLFTILSLLHLF